MAYAAVISLKQTIQRLLNSHIFIVLNETKTALTSAYKELESLQRNLERLDRSRGSSKISERVSVLDGQIRDAAYKLEDVFEFHVSNQSLPQPESLGGENDPFLFSINEEINSFAEMKEEYVKELSNPLPEKDDASTSITMAFGGNKSKVVGLSVEYTKLKDLLIGGGNSSEKVVSLVGMAGIGKTTLAKRIFEDTTVSNHFECRAWVTIGPKHQLKEIIQNILDQVIPYSNEMLEEEVGLHSRLMFKRYLVVLDDIWDLKVWFKLDSLFPKLGFGSRVLVTTRLGEVAEYISSAINGWQPKIDHQIQMHLLGKEESWCLLRDKVFGEELCPLQLEKAGKKIAENCDGLPLAIVTVAKLLSKAEKKAEQWEKVSKRGSSVFVEAYDQILEVLIPSYNYLPQYLKAYFLYMGVFPQNYEIPTSKLIKLWSAEGFVELIGSKL